MAKRPQVGRLPRATRLLIAGDGVSALGTGLVLPLTLIYLHQVRGISLPVVGDLLAGCGVSGVAAVSLAGPALDRFGARRILVLALVSQALAEVGLAWATSVASAAPALVLLGASLGPAVPAYQMMLAGASPDPATQQRAFAIGFTVVNAAVGIGSAIGAAIATTSDPASFQVLYLGNALSCVVFALIALRLPNWRAGRQEGRPKAGYRAIVAQRGLRTVLLAVTLLAFTGYAAQDAGLPAYATIEAHLPVRVVALSMTVNTIVIVISQLMVLRLVRRLRRSTALASCGLLWVISWSVLGLSALPVPPGLRVAFVLGFGALFGLGEAFLAPTIPTLVNGLAGDQSRGRANALSSAMAELAFVISPAISTAMIAAGLAAAWIGLLGAGCAGTVLLAIRLRRGLSAAEDGPDPAPVAAAVPEPALA